jgi:hypothetical protein
LQLGHLGFEKAAIIAKPTPPRTKAINATARPTFPSLSGIQTHFLEEKINKGI